MPDDQKSISEQLSKKGPCWASSS